MRRGKKGFLTLIVLHKYGENSFFLAPVKKTNFPLYIKTSAAELLDVINFDSLRCCSSCLLLWREINCAIKIYSAHTVSRIKRENCFARRKIGGVRFFHHLAINGLFGLVALFSANGETHKAPNYVTQKCNQKANENARCPTKKSIFSIVKKRPNYFEHKNFTWFCQPRVWGTLDSLSTIRLLLRTFFSPSRFKT